MSKRNQSTGSEEVDIDMTPMIDVTFLLLIFFVIISTLTRMETAAEVELPVADQSQTEDAPDPDQLVINIEKDGDIYILGQKRTQAELSSLLAKEARKSLAKDGFSDQAIIIRGDEELEYSKIQWLMKEYLANRIWKLRLAALTEAK